MVRANMAFYLHTRRFKVIFPLYVVLGLLFPILYATNVLQKPADVYSYTQGALGEFVFATVLLVTMLAGDAISQDFGRQGFFTLTQPVRRSEIMLARTLAAFAFAAVSILVWIGVGLATGYAFYGTVVANWGLILAFAMFLVAAVVSFTVLFSSLFKSPTVSVVICVLVVWFVMPIVSGILELVGVEPWFLVTYAGGVVTSLAQQTYPAHSTAINATGGGGGPTITVTVFSPYAWEAAVIMAGYLVVSLALAWLVYSRKELTEAS
jgi:ABC-2 type transport system permease protein